MSVPESLKVWPSVPACYGWLSLDRRGRWRLQGEQVRHAGLQRFIGQNYGCDGAGCWVVRNGPQKVFVALDYAPWVFRLMPDGDLLTHTGVSAGSVTSAHVDDEGAILLVTSMGPGLLDDRDLAALLADCVTGFGEPVDEVALERAISGAETLWWNGLPIDALRREEAGDRLGFVAQPIPADPGH